MRPETPSARTVPARAGERAFTLLELLIVVAIIAILATLVLGGLQSARRKAYAARAKSEISQIKSALSMYDSEVGRFPRTKASNTADYLRNDIAVCYTALRHKPLPALVESCGGPGAPYLEWKPENLGFLGTGNGDNASDTNLPPFNGGLLPGDDYDNVFSISFQTNHRANGSNAVVFLDPWTSPYWYREWASVPEASKDPSTCKITRSPTGPGVVTSVEDRPHEPNRFDIWSYGPNQINEYGDGDDVASWTDVKRK